MKHLLDLGRWKQETDNIQRILRKPLYTINDRGEIVHTTGELPFFCQIVMKKTPQLCNNCRRGELRSMRKGEVHGYQCHAGLDNIAVPVVHEGRVQGALVVPSMRNAKRVDLRLLAKQLGMYEDELREYYYKVPLVDSSTKVIFAKILAALATVLPDYVIETKTHAIRMAEMKILIELQEIALSKAGLRDMLNRTTQLLVQHLRLTDCAVFANETTVRFQKDVSRQLMHAEEILHTHVLKTKTALVVSNLAHETLLDTMQDLPHLACLVLPLTLQPMGTGTIHFYYSSREEIEKHIDLLRKTGSVVSACLMNATLKKEAIESAITDPLTGLYNKRYLLVALEQEILRAKQYKRPCSLMMIDVDNFKSYNDTFGHPAGDALLKTITQVMRDTLGSIEIVCRYGGEEIAVIMPESTPEYARATAERVRAAIAGYDFANRKVTVSIGLCCATSGSTSVDQLISDADKALYEAKNSGKNKVVMKVRVDQHMNVV